MTESGCSEGLTIQVEPRKGCTVVRLSGSASMDVAGTLRDRLIGLISATSPRLVLDVSTLEFISSVGLGGIIAAYLRCRRYDGAIQLVRPLPAIQELLAVTKLDKLFTVHDSVDSAVAAV
jgi:anti-sigma B factor antagonist